VCAILNLTRSGVILMKESEMSLAPYHLMKKGGEPP